MARNKRINKEIQNLMKDNDLKKNCYSIETTESNTHLIGLIAGAAETPFEFGTFRIDIRIPDKYPFEPPNCQFITRVWHPNISSQTGVICLDILKDQWAAAMTVESVLKSLQSFLASPEPNDPQDAVVASQYTKDRKLYNKTAKYWTFTYAVEDQMKPKFDRNQFKDFDEKIDKVKKSLATTHETALSALSCADWNVDKVVANK